MLKNSYENVIKDSQPKLNNVLKNNASYTFSLFILCFDLTLWRFWNSAETFVSTSRIGLLNRAASYKAALNYKNWKPQLQLRATKIIKNYTPKKENKQKKTSIELTTSTSDARHMNDITRPLNLLLSRPTLPTRWIYSTTWAGKS